MPDHQSSILASVTKRFKSSLVHHRLAYHVLPVRVYVSSLQRAANCTPPAPYVKLQYLNQLKLVFMWVLYTGRAGNIWSVSFSTRGRKTGEAGNPRSKARTNSKLSHINSNIALGRNRTRPHRWEAGALTTAPSLLPKSIDVTGYLITSPRTRPKPGC